MEDRSSLYAASVALVGGGTVFRNFGGLFHPEIFARPNLSLCIGSGSAQSLLFAMIYDLPCRSLHVVSQAGRAFA